MCNPPFHPFACKGSDPSLPTILIGATKQVVPLPIWQAGMNTTTVAWQEGITVARLGVGRWEVIFPFPHPDGAEYHVSLTAEEQINLRDTPDILVRQGFKTQNGFEYFIVTGDNGGSADTFVDTPHTVSINVPMEMLVYG